MNKIIIFFVLITLIAGCSFNKNSKFWTSSQNIQEENNQNYKEIFSEEESLRQELNKDLSVMSPAINLKFGWLILGEVREIPVIVHPLLKRSFKQ